MRAAVLLAALAVAGCAADAPESPPTQLASAEAAAPADPPFYVLGSTNSTRFNRVNMDDPEAR